MFTSNSTLLSRDITTIITNSFGAIGNIFDRTLNQIIKSLFSNNEQGFAYDPNDLTEEKINWRKNQLLHTDDFTYGASGNYTAVKEADGWALTAIAQTGAGYSLLGIQYPIGTSSDSRGAGTVVRSIEVKKGTGVFRFGAASGLATLFVDAATMTAIDPSSVLPYTITAIGSDWYRIETFYYMNHLSSSALSNLFGWSAAKATSATLDTSNQVGTVIRVRNPSFAFVPYESTESIPYQAITDFNSDFIRQFPLHTFYQNAAGTVPVTAAGQPIGLIMDKSGRNNHAYQSTSSMRPILQYSPILGSELLANGGFSNGLTEWTATGTPTFTASSGRAYYNGAGGAGTGVLRSSNILAVGKKYIVSYDYEVVQGSFYCGGTYQSTLGGRSITGKGQGQFEILVSDSRDTGVRFSPENSSATVYEFYIDNVSVREVTGYRTDQNYLAFDTVDDKLITTLPAQLTGCTVIRSIPNVGTQILTGQTIPTIYNNNTNHCGLIVINRALTASETSQITKLFNKAAGV